MKTDSCQSVTSTERRDARDKNSKVDRRPGRDDSEQRKASSEREGDQGGSGTRRGDVSQSPKGENARLVKHS